MPTDSDEAGNDAKKNTDAEKKAENLKEIGRVVIVNVDAAEKFFGLGAEPKS